MKKLLLLLLILFTCNAIAQPQNSTEVVVDGVKMWRCEHPRFNIIIEKTEGDDFWDCEAAIEYFMYDDPYDRELYTKFVKTEGVKKVSYIIYNLNELLILEPFFINIYSTSTNKKVREFHFEINIPIIKLVDKIKSWFDKNPTKMNSNESIIKITYKAVDESTHSNNDTKDKINRDGLIVDGPFVYDRNGDIVDLIGIDPT